MKKIYLALIAAVMALSGCTGDLDQYPQVGTTSANVYSTVSGYESVLAKIYGSYSLVGQEKAGGADLSSFGGHDLLRSYFNLQEGTTDEVAFRWLSGDQLWPLAFMNWDNTNPQIADTYYRLYYSIALCNEFIRNAGDGQLGRFSADEQTKLRTYVAEARFMRALSYYLVLDLFRQGPYVDQNTPTSGVNPPAYDAKQLMAYIESELKDIDGTLLADAPYARAGKAAAYALLARMYLNAEVYTGQARYTECIDYCKRVMALGYTLEADYAKLFNGDNHKRTNEVIFAFVNDATEATTWGSGTYFVCGSIGSDNSMTAADYGIVSGWGSWRVHGEFYELFAKTPDDRRCMIWTDGQTQYIDTTLEDGTQGYSPCKWTNLTDDGLPASNSASDGCSTDVPFFRLGEVYLNAAEAVLRGGQGMSRAEALQLVNDLRARAYGNQSGSVADKNFTLNFMIDERGRELYLECLRRTDLVRFDRFTTDKYLWQWKGGVVAGQAIDPKFNYFPIPASELSANPNLVSNY